MKNIFVLPTDKPSRLVKIKDTFFLTSTDDIPGGTFYNIYITSDEEIKEGDWVYFPISNEVLKIGNGPFEASLETVKTNEDCKKIILTTDQDLIKDGVQAIDDEFLEWFVKNPSCETIDIDSIPNSNWGFDLEEPMNLGYKIIIPKEEPVNPNNQEVMFHEEHKEYFYEDFIDGKFVTVWLGKDYIPQEEPKQIKCYCGHTITCDCEPLQETFEEAAERESQLGEYDRSFESTRKNYFIKGAKWQQERMYSEEEIIQLLNFVSKEYNISNGIGWFHTHESIEDISSKEVLDKWFEQFKKK